jgi:hypothetical protein
MTPPNKRPRTYKRWIIDWTSQHTPALPTPHTIHRKETQLIICLAMTSLISHITRYDTPDLFNFAEKTFKGVVLNNSDVAALFNREVGDVIRYMIKDTESSGKIAIRAKARSHSDPTHDHKHRALRGTGDPTPNSRDGPKKTKQGRTFRRHKKPPHSKKKFPCKIHTFPKKTQSIQRASTTTTASSAHSPTTPCCQTHPLAALPRTTQQQTTKKQQHQNQHALQNNATQALRTLHTENGTIHPVTADEAWPTPVA